MDWREVRTRCAWGGAFLVAAGVCCGDRLKLAPERSVEPVVQDTP